MAQDSTVINFASLREVKQGKKREEGLKALIFRLDARAVFSKEDLDEALILIKNCTLHGTDEDKKTSVEILEIVFSHYKLSPKAIDLALDSIEASASFFRAKEKHPEKEYAFYEDDPDWMETYVGSLPFLMKTTQELPDTFDARALKIVKTLDREEKLKNIKTFDEHFEQEMQDSMSLKETLEAQALGLGFEKPKTTRTKKDKDPSNKPK